MNEKKVVFILGRLDAPKYWEPFEKAEDDLTAEGFVPLSPSRLPYDLPGGKLMALQLAMVQAADAVLLTPDWYVSASAQILLGWAKAMNKTIVKPGEVKEALGWSQH